VARTKTIGPDEIHAALDRLAAGVSARHPAPDKLLLLGIANGGVEVARRLSWVTDAFAARAAGPAATSLVSG